MSVCILTFVYTACGTYIILTSEGSNLGAAQQVSERSFRGFHLGGVHTHGGGSLTGVSREVGGYWVVREIANSETVG